jgi:hypothetical protein
MALATFFPIVIAIVLPIVSPVPLVSTRPALFDNCTVLSHRGAGSRAGASTRYGTVPASNLITARCADCPAYGATQDRIVSLIEVGAARAERCEAERHRKCCFHFVSPFKANQLKVYIEVHPRLRSSA